MPENKSNKTGRRRAQTPIDNTYGHLPPQAPDIEQLVIGALMVDKDAFSVVAEILRPETFYDPRNQKIYEAIQAMNMEERPVDIMTVIEELKRQGTFESVGGAPYVLDISQHVASSAHVEYHAQILAQKFLARQLIHFAGEIETNAYDETVDVEELMQHAEGALFELSQKNMRQDYTQIDPVIAEAERILMAATKNKGGLTGVPSGFTGLDDITSGWQASDLVIIAGRPAMGKSTLGVDFARAAALHHNMTSVIFSLEMSKTELAQRIISAEANIPLSAMRRAEEITQERWNILNNLQDKLQNAPLFIDDSPNMSLMEIRAKCRRLKQTNDLKLVVIDYLQLMTSGKAVESRQQEVSDFSRALKLLAKELEVPVVALSQLNRGPEMRQDKKPQLSDLRESGSIEQDADVVFLVHRPDAYDKEDRPGEADIIMAKHRNGPTQTFNLAFLGAYSKFKDMPQDYQSQQEV